MKSVLQQLEFAPIRRLNCPRPVDYLCLASRTTSLISINPKTLPDLKPGKVYVLGPVPFDGWPWPAGAVEPAMPKQSPRPVRYAEMEARRRPSDCTH